MRYILLLILFISANAGDISTLLSKINYLKSLTSKGFKEIDIKYDPFMQTKKIFVKKKNSKKEVVKSSINKVSLTLITILNGRAFINSKWYKKGDKLNGYKIVYIGNDKVMLKKESRVKYLQIEKTKNILKVEKHK